MGQVGVFTNVSQAAQSLARNGNALEDMAREVLGHLDAVDLELCQAEALATLAGVRRAAGAHEAAAWGIALLAGVFAGMAIAVVVTRKG